MDTSGNKKGKFITFEGGEGCGKSTQVEKAVNALATCGIEAVKVREPGGTRLAELVRGLLKEEEEDPPCDRAELLLFLAARAQLVENVIKPALAQGKWVVSDRFSDSTFAYQGYGRGMDLEVIRIANDFACAGTVPDLTLLLEVEPSVAEARRHSREAATRTEADRIERAGGEFHARLREGFEALANANPGRIRRIDANGTPDEVWENIWKSLKPLI